MDLVLVHGAGTGGWLWDDVSALLRAQGHRVWAPTLSGVGERVDEGGPGTDLSTHVGEIIELTADLADVTLVGFSYGGLVAGVTAARVPQRVRRLVYLDGFVPQPGRAMIDALPPEVADRMRQVAHAMGDGWRIPPLPIEQLGGLGRVAGSVDADHLDAVLARRGPHPLGTYEEPAAMDGPFPADRTRYLWCSGKAGDDPMARVAAGVRAAGIEVTELARATSPW